MKHSTIMTKEIFIEMISSFNYSEHQREMILDWFDNCKGKGGREEVIAEGNPQRIWANAARWYGRVRKEEKVAQALGKYDEIPHKTYKIFVAQIKQITQMQSIDETQKLIDSLQEAINIQRHNLIDSYVASLQLQMVQLQTELNKYTKA